MHSVVVCLMNYPVLYQPLLVFLQAQVVVHNVFLNFTDVSVLLNLLCNYFVFTRNPL